MQWKTAIAVAIGGGIGACLRYALNIMISPDLLINATLIVNIIGSLVLGVISGWFFVRSGKEWLQLGLGTGLCGGFTTMSTFAAESVRFASQGTEFIFYLMISLVGGLGAAGLGWLVGKRIAERRRSI